MDNMENGSQETLYSIMDDLQRPGPYGKPYYSAIYRTLGKPDDWLGLNDMIARESDSPDDSIKIPRFSLYNDQLAKIFQELWTEKQLINVNILCQDVVFPCHDIILAANSPVLKEKILRSRPTSRDPQKIRVKTIGADVMELLLDFMYTGEVSIPREMLLETARACRDLQMHLLLEICFQEALSVLHHTNVISWYLFARDRRALDVKYKCLHSMPQMWGELVKNADFLEMNLAAMGNFVWDVKAIGVSPFKILLEAACEWVKCEMDPRCDYLPVLVQRVGLLEYSRQYLEREIDRMEYLLQEYTEYQPAGRRSRHRSV